MIEVRTNNSIKNSITSFLGNGVSFFIAFISQAVFIRLLGAEFLGINGLFSNIISMLNIVELGIGNAIVFNLYKPIADNDTNKISSIMIFYKKVYMFIACIILVLGLSVMPFLKYIVKDVTIDVNIYFVFLLFLFSTLSSYFMVYKRNLIIANQQSYIINIIHMIYLVCLNIFQLILLFYTKNYYVYLIIKILFQILENLVISYISKRKYSYIDLKNYQKLDKKTENDIFGKVKALFFHKIGSVIVLGTDNILISTFFGVIKVGIYSNYNVILNAINTIFGQVITSCTASVGNLMTIDNIEKKYDVFCKIRFINFWISCFTSAALLVLIQPFISIWVGTKYLLEITVVIVLVINFYEKMQRQTYNTFKDSAGIWEEDKFVPIVESIINIVFSILFIYLFGFIGVFLGTMISSCVLWFYSYPKYVYGKIFEKKIVNYYIEGFKYNIVFLIIIMLVSIIAFYIKFENVYLCFIIRAIIVLLLPNMLIILIFKNDYNYKYVKIMIENLLNNVKGSFFK